MADNEIPIYTQGRDEPVIYVAQGQRSIAPREQAVHAWHRRCRDGRIEVMCRAPGFRIRITAPEVEAWEAVEMFERWTGLSVQSEQRPQRMRVAPGQITIMEELESGGNDGAD